MRAPSAALSLSGYIIAFGLFIIWASATTISASLSGHHFQAGRLFMLGLASIELAAAVAFMFARPRLIAGAVLILVFVLACCLTLRHEGTFPGQLVFDLCTTLFILLQTGRAR